MPRICPTLAMTLLLVLGSLAAARPALSCAAPTPPQAVWPRDAYPLQEINTPPGEGTPRNVQPTVVLPPHRPLRPAERVVDPSGRRLTRKEAWLRRRFSRQELELLAGKYPHWGFREREWASRFATAELTLQLRTEEGAQVEGQLRSSVDPPPRCRRAPICVNDDVNDRSCTPYPCGSRWLAFEPSVLLPAGRYELVLATRDGKHSSVVSRFAVRDAVDRTPPRLDGARAMVFEPVMVMPYYSYPEGFAAYSRHIIIDPVQETGEYCGRIAVWLAGEGEVIDFSRPPTTYVARPGCSFVWSFGWSFTDPTSRARMGIRLVDQAGNMSEPIEFELDVARPMQLRFFRLWSRGHYLHPGSWPPRLRLPALLALCLFLGLAAWWLGRARGRAVAGLESIIADTVVETISQEKAAAFTRVRRHWRRARRIGALGGLALCFAAVGGLLVAWFWDGSVHHLDLEVLAALDPIQLLGVAAMLGALLVDRMVARRLHRRFQRCLLVFEHYQGR